MNKFFAIIILSTLSISNITFAKPMTMIDLLEVSSLRSGRLSPDGNQILFVKSDADWDLNKNVTRLWLTDINGGTLKQISSNLSDVKSPRWSPDGRQILFLSKRGSDKHDQIYILPLTGGEAIRLSNHDTPISNAQWSKDGRDIYFLALDVKNKAQIERENQQDDIFKFEQDFQQKHLWKITLDEAEKKRITYGDYSIGQFNISQNGNKITHLRAPNPLLDAALTGEIWLMDNDGRNAEQITDNKNPEMNLELSPDNNSILYIAWTNENDEAYFENNLFIIPAKGGSAKQMLGDFDHDIQQAHWSENGKNIYFKANLGVHNELFIVDVKSGEITQLTDGQHTVVNWHYQPTVNNHIMSVKTAHNNGDFWHLSANDNSTFSKITSIFDHLTRDFDLPRQEIITWKGQDGTDIEGTIIYPNDYKKSKRYPLVVQTHGGPRAADQWGIFSTTSYGPILAANSYVILRPNYRGSLGYGDDFVRDMVGHYFNQSHLDVMAGVDHLIEQGIVDGDKMVKMGYSAGGHMTNKIITFTNRFKAASSAAGTVNWISMYSQSDTRIYRTSWFNGTPWQKNAPIETYWDQSPLKDIANVTTPTMIIVGGADIRVPKQQSIELYRALISNGVETDLYIVPREQHGWKELRHKLSKMNVEMSWFEKYVHGRSFTWHKIIQEVLPITVNVVK